VKLAVVTCAYHPSTGETEAGSRVPDQPKPHSETTSQDPITITIIIVSGQFFLFTATILRTQLHHIK
jgi:hypothetical protein